MKSSIRFTLNDKPVTWTGEDNRMLLWVLRTDYNLTGSKFGCGEGFCGACTLLIEGEAVRSCQLPMKEVQGKHVTTIEGLTKNGDLHPLQKAFIKHNALQCGFCTPGMILNAVSLLSKKPVPSQSEILKGMEDNLCRCGTYTRILQAISEVVQTQQKGGV
ncbi:MAG: (2Fe-2S)-binding protein [Candidatus Aminicenantes bacterium]|nr:(2Fe-2S)-binding protein [Candidatus Aminicenantes bacterium]